jgi:diguanylate cyclase (GGDEF)-like protein
VPRQNRISDTPAAALTGEVADPYELRREALAAALPDITDVTADLVGWVTPNHATGRARLPLPRSRQVLAAALGVDDAALGQMRDEDVTRAIDRLRALVDQCARLADQVTVDELTGALRRGAGLAALQREVDRTRRFPGKGLVAIFVDVDGLKEVNDRDGHAAGDERLRTTVAAMRERLRSYDLIIRYGGDEFLCVLTDSGAPDAARTVTTLREHVLACSGGTISAGIAELAAGDSVDALVERADAALYAGRRARAPQPARAIRR